MFGINEFVQLTIFSENLEVGFADGFYQVESSKLINFDKLGKLLGCSGVTAKKVIADRLPYLLDPKDY